MCGRRRTIFAPGKRFRACASSAFEWKPTTACSVAGALDEPLGATIAATVRAATRSASRRGACAGRVGIQAAWGAGKGSCPSSARRFGCGTLLRGMAYPDRVSEGEQARVRLSLDGSGESNVATGLPVLDHLLGLLARYGSLDLDLQVAPETGEAEVAAAGKALGEALREPLADDE